MSNVRSLGMLPDPRTTLGGFSVPGFLFGLGDGPFLCGPMGSLSGILKMTNESIGLLPYLGVPFIRAWCPGNIFARGNCPT